MKKKKMTAIFRPEISDSSGMLRKRFAELLASSELSRTAFTRKVFEFGLDAAAKLLGGAEK